MAHSIDDNVLGRERAHHDKWAGEIDVAAIDVRTMFEGSTSPENRFILRHLGNISGKRIIDIGCGAGEAAVYFAARGAYSVCTDYSSAMLDTALRLAKHNGVGIEAREMNAMELQFKDDEFDIAYAANLLHHVDPETVLMEMRRVVKPGGMVCFWDPLKHNPVINVYRRLATGVRTDDERPLDIKVIDLLKSIFTEVKYDTFWIASLWIFIHFFLIERVDPNKERYWKKILLEEPRLRKRYYRLEKIDGLIKNIDYLKRFAWNIAAVARK